VRRGLAAGIIVVNDRDEMLCIYNRWRRRWEYPGGKARAGEWARMCALRECREETGLDIDLSEIWKLGESDSMGIRYKTYCVSVQGRPPIRLNRFEHSEFAWVRLEFVPELIDPRMRRRVEEYLT
jgi:8-oxo-dGTP pyrophosphatase MutT (NUDIX family)